MKPIKEESYHSGVQEKRKPLMIGCSGGGGHNAAIMGIAGFLKAEYPDVILPSHTAVLHSEKSAESPARKKIDTGVGIMDAPAIGGPVKAVVSLTSFPVLPDRESLNTEIKKLSNTEAVPQSADSKETPIGKKRVYIDMLLDVYPAGYESAAIWNVLQRTDKTSELKKLIALQSMSDQENYEDVKHYYVEALKHAATKEREPYTEIISTQAMALPALCDAVAEYNQWLEQEKLKDPQSTIQSAQPVVIQQYMTDLPTKGAVHFFNVLSKLDETQQKQMNLYGVGMDDAVLKHFFPPNGETSFKELFNIPAQKNPMVRDGFKNPELDNSEKFDKTVKIALKGKLEGPSFEVVTGENKQEVSIVEIQANKKIASIMLGSQGGNDTVDYIKPLLDSGIDQVFVFGGVTNSYIKNEIEELLKIDKYKDRIVPLPNQDPEHMAPLMSRSNVVIVRGGGLSVMEQLAMNHNPQQTVLIHHANSSAKELTSGISWEDYNVIELIADLNKRGVHAEKTTPERSVRHIAEARLIAAVKRMGAEVDVYDATQFIKKMSDIKLKKMVEALQESETAEVPKLPPELEVHFANWNKKANDNVTFLEGNLNKGKEHLAKIIATEMEHLEGSSQYWKSDDNHMFLDPRQLDIPKILEDVKQDAEPFKHASSAFHSAVTSYQAYDRLSNILAEDPKKLSANQKMEKFQEEYRKPETKKDLVFGNDNFLVRIVKEIQYRLAKYFPIIEKNLSFQQNFRKQMSDLREKENIDPEIANSAKEDVNSEDNKGTANSFG